MCVIIYMLYCFSEQVKPISFEAPRGGAYNNRKHLKLETVLLERKAPPIIDYAVCIISKHILANFP